MKTIKFSTLEDKAYKDQITAEDALFILQSGTSCLFDIIACADRIRRRYKGNKVGLCSIINAKSGKCSEDCAFCSQSVNHNTNIDEFPLVEKDAIVDVATLAAEGGSMKFGIVTSGKNTKNKSEFNKIRNAVSAISKKLHACASLGIMDKESLLLLKEAGLKEYHHNLETSRSFFRNICTTHSYDDNVNTVKAAKEAGLRICCGGIFGMGESNKQRVEFAFTLKELAIDSIPLNFLNPVKGTRLEDVEPLQPIEILKIIAMFRFVHPEKDIKVAGGREVNLRDLQSFMFAAGANSTMLGNYLTTSGRSSKEDIQMIKDLGLEIV